MADRSQTSTGLWVYVCGGSHKVHTLPIFVLWGKNVPLKTLDTIGNCQRLVLTVGAYQHMHKITNLWNI